MHRSIVRFFLLVFVAVVLGAPDTAYRTVDADIWPTSRISK